MQGGSISPTKIIGKKQDVKFYDPNLKINYGSTDLNFHSPRGNPTPVIAREMPPPSTVDHPKSMNVHNRADRVKETNLLILFNNETMILGAPKSRDRSNNASKLENVSPRKLGNTSARINNFSNNTRKTSNS